MHLYVEGPRSTDRQIVSASTPIDGWGDVAAAAKGLTQTMSMVYGVLPQRMSWKVLQSTQTAEGWFIESEK